MGTVYLGRLDGAAGFARCIAAKALHPHLAKDPEFVAMFLDEARLAARVRHPNVVSTIDVIVDSGKIVMVMEYVHGETLRTLIRAAREHEGRLPPPIVASAMYGALLGLQAAHDAHNEKGEPLGLVHRDVTPHNIVVGTDGVARVLDFGIAKAMGQLHTTKEGTIKGKFAYMAPEQIRGDFVGRQADVYSAGVVLWEALTGERLFPGSNEGEILERVLFSTPERPSRRAPGIPEALDAVVMRAIARDRAHRFGSARDMAAALVKACPAAPPDRVGEMVERLAHDLLTERAERIRRIEMRQRSPAPRTSVTSITEEGPRSGTETARGAGGSPDGTAPAVASIGSPHVKPRKNALVLAVLVGTALGFAGFALGHAPSRATPRSASPAAAAATAPDPAAAPPTLPAATGAAVSAVQSVASSAAPVASSAPALAARRPSPRGAKAPTAAPSASAAAVQAAPSSPPSSDVDPASALEGRK
jgi:serine/threonine-protein kinase